MAVSRIRRRDLVLVGSRGGIKRKKFKRNEDLFFSVIGFFLFFFFFIFVVFAAGRLCVIISDGVSLSLSLSFLFPVFFV